MMPKTRFQVRFPTGIGFRRKSILQIWTGSIRFSQRSAALHQWLTFALAEFSEASQEWAVNGLWYFDMEMVGGTVLEDRVEV